MVKNKLRACWRAECHTLFKFDPRSIIKTVWHDPHHPVLEGQSRVREGWEAELAPLWVWPLPDKAEKLAINWRWHYTVAVSSSKMRVLPSSRWAFQWHSRCYLTCLLFHADSGSLQVWGLGVHCGIVKGVRAQTRKAIGALRASDGNLLCSILGGYRSRDRDKFPF